MHTCPITRQFIVWKGQYVTLYQMGPPHKMYAVRTLDVNYGLDQKSHYFCRDGQYRTVATDRTGEGFLHLYNNPASAHYESLEDFLACHPSLLGTDIEDSWSLGGAL